MDRSAEGRRGAWRISALGFAMSAILFFSLISFPAFSATRLSEEQGFGRLAFSWPGGVPPQKASVVANVLVLEFDRAPEVDVSRFAIDMPRYVALARAENEGKVLRIALKANFTLNVLRAENSLYVDLLPPDWQGAPPPLPADVLARLAAAEEAKRAAEEEIRAAEALGVSNPKSQLPEVKLRVGRHEGYSRIVFDWNDPVLYEVVRKGNVATVTFDRTAKVLLGIIRADLPPYLQNIEAREFKGKLAVMLTLKPEVEVVDFREGLGVVFDLKPVAQKPDTAQVAEAERAPTDITPKNAEADTRTIESEEAKATAEAEAAKAAAAAAASQTTEQAIATPSETPAPEIAVAPEPQAEPEVLAVGGSVFEGRIELRFPWMRPTGAAVYERNGRLWIVFDETKPLDFMSFDDETRLAVGDIRPLPVEGGTALSLPMPMGASVSAFEEGTAWRVSILPPVGARPLAQGRMLSLSRLWRESGEGVVSLDLKRGREVIHLHDPQTRERIIIATARAPLQAMASDRSFVEFMALRSVHGVAIQPIADDLSVTMSADALEITRAQGLALSGGGEAAPSVVASLSDAGMTGASPAAMDFDAWRKASGESFTEGRKKHATRIATTTPALREQEMFAYARFLMAYNLGPEALAVLQQIARETPRTGLTKEYLALHAVTSVMSGRFSSAIGDLSNNDFAGDPYAALWRGIAFARTSRWENARADFTLGESAADALDQETRAMARVIMAQASLDAGDVISAEGHLRKLPLEFKERRWQEEALLVRARIAEGKQKWDDAERLYREAITQAYPPVAARARYQLALMQHGKDQLSEDKLVEELDRLRYAWRGDDFEIQLLKTLSDLHIKRDEVPQALAAMKTATLSFPDSDVAHEMGSRASDLFADFFINGGADKLPAVQALALYYNYQSLTPVGQKGDRMVRHLADRLASVDLLPQAQELLQHQVDQRLHSGFARAQVAAKLAGLYLMDRKPQQALDVLRSTRQDQLPADVELRRRLIEAHALAGLKQVDLAVEILDDILDPKAMVAKADVLWDAQRWPAAGMALEDLIKAAAPGKGALDADMRFQVMRCAIAYSLSGDEGALARLRTRFGEQMRASPDASAFAAISDAIVTEGPAFREVAARIAQVNTLDKFMEDMRKDERKGDQSASAGTATPQVMPAL